MMDALSHLLDDVHFSGAEYLYVNALQGWQFNLAKQTVFYVVLTGDVKVKVAGQTHKLSTGNIVFMPYGAAHSFFDANFDAPKTHGFNLELEFKGARYDPVVLGHGHPQALVLGVRCLLDSEMAKPLLSSLPDYILIEDGLNGEGPAWLKLGLEFLALESERFRPGRDTLINRLISMFFIECVRDYVEQLPVQSNTWLNAVRDPYLAPVLSAIHAQPAHPWTVVDLAKLACLSRSSFAERFANVMGQPPLAYLTEYRLRQAARYLTIGDMSVNRVSERVGYSSETAFSQAFKRQYGVSPSQYRKQGRD
ncbi:MAG: AraC family transcriptional regulator [Agitococcus sp.]